MRKEKLEELQTLIKMYQTISKNNTEIVKGKFLQIERADYTLTNDQTITREKLVKVNGDSAATVLPITETGEVILIVQPRVVTKLGVGVELPAGYIDKDEEDIAAAKRELIEETGYIPAHIRKLGHDYYQDEGCSSAYNACFLAIGCKEISRQKLDDDEFVSKFTCTYEEMLELVELGYINGAGSLLTIERSKEILKPLLEKNTNPNKEAVLKKGKFPPS